MSEVKNEGLEVVAWEVYYQDDGSFNAITRSKDTVEEYSKMAYDIYPLCRHSEALAGYSVRDARIAELARYKRFESLYAESEREAIQLRAELASSDLALCESRANDLESTRQLDVAKAELAAIKAQEPMKLHNDVREYLRDGIDSATHCEEGDVDYEFANGLGLLLGSIYAAPVAKQVVIPEPRFYWADSEEGSFGSPEEWAQDYYDYNGEKPESVLLSCAASLPDREYDSFEFDGSGNCISCRLVGEDSARLNAADHSEGGAIGKQESSEKSKC